MNTLIVEGQDDVAFIEYLIQYLQLDNVEVKQFAVNKLGGFSEAALIKDLTGKLDVILRSANRKPIEKIGIILDLDEDNPEKENSGGYANRLEAVNNAIKAAFKNSNTPNLPKSNQLVTFLLNDDKDMEMENRISIEIACHFIGINKGGIQQGELEDFLKEIAKKHAPHANCLSSWNCCLEKLKLKLEKEDKEFNKLWVHYYLKYDAFISYSNEAKPQAKYCKLENIFTNAKSVKEYYEKKILLGNNKLFEENVTPELFDFEKEEFNELQQLKEFLKLFKVE